MDDTVQPYPSHRSMTRARYQGRYLTVPPDAVQAMGLAEDDRAVALGLRGNDVFVVRDQAGGLKFSLFRSGAARVYIEGFMNHYGNRWREDVNLEWQASPTGRSIAVRLKPRRG